jgi:hypothetical protein
MDEVLSKIEAEVQDMLAKVKRSDTEPKNLYNINTGVESALRRVLVVIAGERAKLEV